MPSKKRTQFRAMRSVSGFTLAEMLVVFVLLSGLFLVVAEVFRVSRIVLDTVKHGDELAERYALATLWAHNHRTSSLGEYQALLTLRVRNDRLEVVKDDEVVHQILHEGSASLRFRNLAADEWLSFNQSATPQFARLNYLAPGDEQVIWVARRRADKSPTCRLDMVSRRCRQ